MSSVFALKARPQIPISFPSSEPPANSLMLSTTRLSEASLLSSAASISGRSRPKSDATDTSARVSLGKQDPPQPGPGERKLGPILESDPSPSTRSSTHAHTFSQRAARSFTNDRRMARYAFDEYLISSADSMLVAIFRDAISL